jgi:hypothetical protein
MISSFCLTQHCSVCSKKRHPGLEIMRGGLNDKVQAIGIPGSACCKQNLQAKPAHAFDMGRIKLKGLSALGQKGLLKFRSCLQIQAGGEG